MYFYSLIEPIVADKMLLITNKQTAQRTKATIVTTARHTRANIIHVGTAVTLAVAVAAVAAVTVTTHRCCMPNQYRYQLTN